MYINTRIKVILILLAYLGVSAQALVTFEAGQIAKAEDFNTNFSELNSKIESIQNIQAPNAKVNGVDMYVSGSSLGYYFILTPRGNYVSVSEDGFPYTRLYFESDDCTGQPYESAYLDEDVEVGHTYINPKINNIVKLSYFSGSTLYADFENIVKLNYNSYYYGEGTGTCSSYSGITIASATKQNDINITGISFPVAITEIGSSITVSDEVGAKIETSASTSWSGQIVYANGRRIGVVNYLYISADFSISIILDDYPNQIVTMYKDGTYTGLNFGSLDYLYYLTTDCTGNGYVKVLNDFDKEWWVTSELSNGDVINNDKYYSLSSNIYKITDGAKSKKSAYSDSCYTNSDIGSHGYRLATEISSPNFPIYDAPITIESFSEDVLYDNLIEAN